MIIQTIFINVGADNSQPASINLAMYLSTFILFMHKQWMAKTRVHNRFHHLFMQELIDAYKSKLQNLNFYSNFSLRFLVTVTQYTKQSSCPCQPIILSNSQSSGKFKQLNMEFILYYGDFSCYAVVLQQKLIPQKNKF